MSLLHVPVTWTSSSRNEWCGDHTSRSVQASKGLKSHGSPYHYHLRRRCVGCHESRKGADADRFPNVRTIAVDGAMGLLAGDAIDGKRTKVRVNGRIGVLKVVVSRCIVLGLILKISPSLMHHRSSCFLLHNQGLGSLALERVREDAHHTQML